MKSLILLSLLFIFNANAVTWQDNLEAWKTSRVESLKKPHGWLSLIGMEWLHNGENSIGSAQDNSIILPSGPAHIGSFIFKSSLITFTPKAGVKIFANNEQVKDEIDVAMDSSGAPTVFTIDTFKFHVIERGKPALRIKDSKAATRTNFNGIKYYPATDKFRVKAEFIPYNPTKTLEIINVLGLLNKTKSPGYLAFAIDGKNFKLDVIDAGDEFEVIFADRTSGRATYGPGRFLYLPKPKNGNTTTLDFNQAFNPPCAFTDYSTCPLPPPQNRIRFFIEAGEKKYHK